MTPITDCTTLARMDRQAQIRGPEITLRRAILERFPMARERRAWLRWAADLSKPHGAVSGHIVMPSTGRASRCNQQSDT